MDTVETAVRLDDEGQHTEAMILLFAEIERLRTALWEVLALTDDSEIRVHMTRSLEQK
jgi:hypothetical protein